MGQSIQAGSLLAQMQALQGQAAGRMTAVSAGEGAGFAQLFGNMLDKVAGQQQAAREVASAFEVGDGDTDLSDVMIAMQKANVSFAALTQVRNKLVQAYQDIMQMPV